MSTTAATLKELANEYLRFDQDPETRNEILQYLANDETKLMDLMTKRLEFGTAGLRGAVGAGYSKMNELVVIQYILLIVNVLELLKELLDICLNMRKIAN